MSLETTQLKALRRALGLDEPPATRGFRNHLRPPLYTKIHEACDRNVEAGLMTGGPDWHYHCTHAGMIAAGMTRRQADIVCGTQADADLGLSELGEANKRRVVEWLGGKPADTLSEEFAALELAGEVGEFCNAVKKMIRARHGLRGGEADPANAQDELADVVICASLCALRMGWDLPALVRRKFNATSDKHGFATRL